MRTLFYLSMTALMTFITAVTHMNKEEGSNSDQVVDESIYDYSFISLQGDSIQLSEFKGKKILFVNVASKCGFTPQYEGLQKLYNSHKDQLVIIGFPCNQFGEQEQGSHEEIASFCKRNYGVEFLISEKIKVKGEGQHPIYRWLTDKTLNGKESSSVKWNFQKYLVDENGNYVDFWYSLTKPMSKKITKHLQKN